MGIPYKTSSSPVSGRQYTAPTAPPYEEENDPTLIKPDDTSVEFCVSDSYQRQIIRADKKAVFDSDSGLKKLIFDKTIRYVNGQYLVNCRNIPAFEAYIRFLETNFIKFKSVEESLDILEVCLTYFNLELLKKCVFYLDYHINGENVIQIYRLLRTYNNKIELPSPTKGRCCSSPVRRLSTADHYVSALQENCLLFIDKNAEVVFKTAEIVDLRYDELNNIISRNSLELKSELILVELLAIWSWKQCEQKKIECNNENRRRVLGALCYSCRFLAMPSKLFPIICERIELLDENEKQLVETILQGKKCSNLNSEQMEMVERFKKSRPVNGKSRPIHLSDRSHPKKPRLRNDYYESKRSCSDCFYIALCVCFG